MVTREEDVVGEEEASPPEVRPEESSWEVEMVGTTGLENKGTMDE